MVVGGSCEWQNECTDKDLKHRIKSSILTIMRELHGREQKIETVCMTVCALYPYFLPGAVCSLVGDAKFQMTLEVT